MKRLVTLGILLLAVLGMAYGQRVQPGNDYLEVYTEETDEGGYAFFAENRHMIPLHVRITFPKLTNLSPTVRLPYTRTIPAESTSGELFRLEVREPARSRGYSVQYSYSRGDPEATSHDDSYLYLFPFAHGTKHRITQGYNGRYTHTGENKYAIDFAMDVGTPVHAARGGVVVEVAERWSGAGTSQQYEQYANRILVYHEDGSFANYAHLKEGGALVEPGDRVEAGDRIGLSGNTGRSSGPHLHFDVRVPTKKGVMQSIPVSFRGRNGKAVEPRRNGVYYAYHPGKPPFEITYGRNISPADYRDYSASIEQTGELRIRTEREDLTYVVFLQNGHGRAIDATVRFRLEGMRAETSLPVEVRVPAKTEVFLTLLRADPDARSWRFSPKIRYRFDG